MLLYIIINDFFPHQVFDNAMEIICEHYWNNVLFNNSKITTTFKPCSLQESEIPPDSVSPGTFLTNDNVFLLKKHQNLLQLTRDYRSVHKVRLYVG